MSASDNADWEEILRRIMGSEASDELINKMRMNGLNPEEIPVGMFSTNFFGGVFDEVKKIVSQSDGPVNWEMAKQSAIHTVGQSDSAVTVDENSKVVEALKTASLWLDAVTDFSPPLPSYKAWSRSKWLEDSMPGWKIISEPIATNGARSLVSVLKDQLSELGDAQMPVEMQEVVKMLNSLVGLEGSGFSGLVSLTEKVSATVFGMQLGAALGELSKSCFGSSDLGIPLSEGTSGLIPENMNEFLTGLSEPPEEVLAFLATREVACTRLFHAVPWLRAHIVKAISDYAKEIHFDVDEMERAAEGIDPFDSEKLSEALNVGLSMMEPNQAQINALNRLEVVLALVEAWIDVVSTQALVPYLANPVALREMMRRRRAATGPAEQAFTGLIGLKLSPKRIRQAVELVEKMARIGGNELRDKLWAHPDLLPDLNDLENSDSFLNRWSGNQKSDEADTELAAILDGSLGYASGLQPGADSEGDAEVNEGPNSEE